MLRGQANHAPVAGHLGPVHLLVAGDVEAHQVDEAAVVPADGQAPEKARRQAPAAGHERLMEHVLGLEHAGRVLGNHGREVQVPGAGGLLRGHHVVHQRLHVEAVQAGDAQMHLLRMAEGVELRLLLRA